MTQDEKIYFGVRRDMQVVFHMFRDHIGNEPEIKIHILDGMIAGIVDMYKTRIGLGDEEIAMLFYKLADTHAVPKSIRELPEGGFVPLSKKDDEDEKGEDKDIA